MHHRERERLRATGVLPGHVRNKRAQDRFAKAVLARDHHRCTACGSTEQLEAHHVIPLHHGGDNRVSNGVTLCKSCHKAVDRFAR
jgi:5-methylcytosine-specific restriction endonuclease McrA